MNFSYKQIWLIAYPILISLLMEHMINVTDTAFLGHVGEVELEHPRWRECCIWLFICSVLDSASVFKF